MREDSYDCIDVDGHAFANEECCGLLTKLFLHLYLYGACMHPWRACSCVCVCVHAHVSRLYQVSVVLTTICTWLLWACCYMSQMYPIL